MSVITVGNFDGVHLGHRLLLETVRKKALETGDKSIAVTFDVHPRKGTPLLCDNAEKERKILSLGIDEVVFLPFEKIENFDGDEFLKYLKDELGLSYFVCGSDFRFGKNAACNVDFLRKESEKFGFGLSVITFDAKTKTSSTTIRKLLAEGDTEEAEKLLGYRYSVSADIVSGKHIGRLLGYPTVNIFPEKNILLPRYGVYATEIILDGESFSGITNVGVRPTFDDGDRPNIETFVIGDRLSKNYSRATVVFKKFIRPEKKFPSEEALSAQIANDVKIASEIK